MADTSTAVEADGDMTTVPLGDSASGAAGGGAADLPVDPTAAAGAVTDAISVPDGWFLSPVAPITVPMGMLTFIPFDSNVKNDMMDKVDPDDTSPAGIMKKDTLDYCKKLLGEDKFSEMLDDAASIGGVNERVNQCFVCGTVLPIACFPCFYFGCHASAQSAPQSVFEKWQQYMKTIEKGSDYNFNLYFRPGNLLVSLIGGSGELYQKTWGFVITPTQDALAKIAAEEAAAKLAMLGGTTPGTDAETKEDANQEDHWLVAALGLGKNGNKTPPADSTSATAAEPATTAQDPITTKSTDPDVSVTDPAAAPAQTATVGGEVGGTPNAPAAAGAPVATTDAAPTTDVAPTTDGGAVNGQVSTDPTPAPVEGSVEKKKWFSFGKKKQATDDPAATATDPAAASTDANATAPPVTDAPTSDTAAPSAVTTNAPADPAAAPVEGNVAVADSSMAPNDTTTPPAPAAVDPAATTTTTNGPVTDNSASATTPVITTADSTAPAGDTTNTNATVVMASSGDDTQVVNPAAPSAASSAPPPKKKSWFGGRSKSTDDSAAAAAPAVTTGDATAAPATTGDATTDIASAPSPPANKKSIFSFGKKKDKAAAAGAAPVTDATTDAANPPPTTTQDEYTVPPAKEEPVESKPAQEVKPTPQFDCGCT